VKDVIKLVEAVVLESPWFKEVLCNRFGCEAVLVMSLDEILETVGGKEDKAIAVRVFDCCRGESRCHDDRVVGAS
jgi:hypothetical protein